MSHWSEFEHEFCFPSDTAEGQRVGNLLMKEIEGHEFPEKIAFGIRLALEEALVNAIKHGNQFDTDKTVRVRYKVDNNEVAIEITDEGPGFDPQGVPDPTAPENLERPCGRGLMLMRAYMTELEFIPPGNVCRMRRVLD